MSPRTGDSPSQADVRVLALRGDPSDLAVLASVVAAHDFDLRVLDSAELLGPEVAHYQPDAIILDVTQGALGGYELCARLKADPATSSVPIVLTSSLDGPEARTLGFAAGCDELLEKPVNRHLLAFRLRSFARLRRAWVRTNPSERILTALRRFAQAKDRARGVDDERLVRACIEFGDYLGLSGPERRALEHAAALHDIGEIAIPETILAKRGPLSRTETDIMQRHTEIGAALLEPLPDTSLLVAIVRHHHERWDGGGYPHGLAGDDIPRLARAFRILDVFDALTRVRPYQASHALPEALAVLHRDCTHGGLDPVLLAEFARWLDASGAAIWLGEG